jgi:hypothetical protein
MPGGTHAQRQAWGLMGALKLHGSGKTNVGPAHEALRLKWERQADPTGILPAHVRAKRGAMLRRAFMIELSLRAAEAKRIRRLEKAAATEELALTHKANVIIRKVANNLVVREVSPPYQAADVFHCSSAPKLLLRN